MYVCMHVCMYVCAYMHVRYSYMYVCTYVRVYLSIKQSTTQNFPRCYFPTMLLMSPSSLVLELEWAMPMEHITIPKSDLAAMR